MKRLLKPLILLALGVALNAQQFVDQRGLAAPDLPVSNAPTGSSDATFVYNNCSRIATVRLPASPYCSAVSPLDPVYLYAHFRDDDQTRLRLSYSRDGADFADLEPHFQADQLRDPSVMLAGGTFFFLATPAAGARVQFFSSTDLVNFSGITLIDMADYDPHATAAWAPEWWRDPNGNIYFWVAVSDSPDPLDYTTPFTPYLVQFDVLSGSVVGAPAAITIYGSSEGRTFDFFPFYSNGAYYLFYADQQNDPAVKQPIAFATSPSLYGPYYQQTPDGADYFGWGNSFQTEAPALFRLPDGCVRIVVDEWVYPPGYSSWAGRSYAPFYQDSCPQNAPLFSQASLSGPQPLAISRAEHGTIIPLNSTIAAAPVLRNASPPAGPATDPEPPSFR